MSSRTESRRRELPGQGFRSRILRSVWEAGGSTDARYRDLVSARVEPGMRILHAGCGWDRNDITRSHRDGCWVVGVDRDPRVGPLYHSTFVRASVRELPFADGEFDLILCEYVVEHLEDPAPALAEMARVLRPGSHLLILTPNLYSYKSLAARLTPQILHTWAGRVRYGRGHEDDMYPTLYRCNTVARITRFAREAGLRDLSIGLVTNGPTWFERVPGLFELFHLFHLLIRRSRALRQLRCALVVDARKPEGARSGLGPGSDLGERAPFGAPTRPRRGGSRESAAGRRSRRRACGSA